MFVMFGTRSCGKVDRVPGFAYVVTHFFHINYLPLIPTKSWIVLEGTEDGDGFRGVDAGFSGKSILAGYIRTWAGLGGLIATAIGGFHIGRDLFGDNDGAGYAIGAVLAGLALASFFVTNRFWMLLLGAVLIGLLGGWGAAIAMKLKWIENLQTGVFAASGLLTLYGLTRFWDRAGRERAVDMADKLGIDRLQAEELFAEMDRGN